MTGRRWTRPESVTGTWRHPPRTDTAGTGSPLEAVDLRTPERQHRLEVSDDALVVLVQAAMAAEVGTPVRCWIAGETPPRFELGKPALPVWPPADFSVSPPPAQKCSGSQPPDDGSDPSQRYPGVPTAIVDAAVRPGAGVRASRWPHPTLCRPAGRARVEVVIVRTRDPGSRHLHGPCAASAFAGGHQCRCP